ncbi:hypothetical protein ScPMuIL_006014 [Solemya velum]
MTSYASSDIYVGLDLGTTSVKLCLYNKNTKAVIRNTSSVTLADVISDVNCNEQDPYFIFKAIEKCVLDIPTEERERVKCIGVTGQMHGILLWRNGLTQYSDDFRSRKLTSNLYTWQDLRCSDDFLSSLPEPDSLVPVSSGYGCATLFWLARNDPEFLKGFCFSGSIMDCLVFVFCGLERPVMSEQICSSWGYYNTKQHSWNIEILEKADFPVPLLPSVVPSGGTAGTLAREWFGIPAGVPVLAGLGDLQCAMFSAIQESHEAALNMSTSFQLGFLVSNDATLSKLDNCKAIQVLPYFEEKSLAVAASLNGGNVLRSFVLMLKSWMTSLGIELEEGDIWDKLSQLVHGYHGDDNRQPPQIIPTIYGERHAPEVFGSVFGLRESNTDLHSVYAALCRGLLVNMSSMLPQDLLQYYGVTHIVATGSVVSRNPVIASAIRENYDGMKVVTSDKCDSALGVALVAAQTDFENRAQIVFEEFRSA